MVSFESLEYLLAEGQDKFARARQRVDSGITIDEPIPQQLGSLSVDVSGNLVAINLDRKYVAHTTEKRLAELLVRAMRAAEIRASLIRE